MHTVQSTSIAAIAAADFKKAFPGLTGRNSPIFNSILFKFSVKLLYTPYVPHISFMFLPYPAMAPVVVVP